MIVNGSGYIGTKELMEVLEGSSSIADVLHEYESSVNNPPLNEYLARMLQAYGRTPVQLIHRTCLSKSFVYQILDGTRVPGRDVLLRMAFAIGLNLDETQRLLTIAGRGVLYPRVRRDAVVIFCLRKHRTLEQANDLLEEIGESLLV